MSNTQGPPSFQSRFDALVLIYLDYSYSFELYSNHRLTGLVSLCEPPCGPRHYRGLFCWLPGSIDWSDSDCDQSISYSVYSPLGVSPSSQISALASLCTTVGIPYYSVRGNVFPCDSEMERVEGISSFDAYTPGVRTRIILKMKPLLNSCAIS